MLNLTDGRSSSSLGGPIAWSVALHVLLIAAVLAGAAVTGPRLLSTGTEGWVHVSLVEFSAPRPAGPPAAPPAVPPARQRVVAVRPVPPAPAAESPVRREERIEMASLHSQEAGSDAPRWAAKAEPGGSGSGPGSAPSKDTGTAPGSGAGEGVTLAVPKYHENPSPDYPDTARLRGYEGLVLLAAEVRSDGRVGSLQLKKSCGYDLLDRSALKAVKAWRFEPGKRMGTPVSMWVDVPVRFVLREGS